jgi:hypothetical protein
MVSPRPPLTPVPPSTLPPTPPSVPPPPKLFSSGSGMLNGLMSIKEQKEEHSNNNNDNMNFSPMNKITTAWSKTSQRSAIRVLGPLLSTIATTSKTTSRIRSPSIISHFSTTPHDHSHDDDTSSVINDIKLSDSPMMTPRTLSSAPQTPRTPTTPIAPPLTDDLGPYVKFVDQRVREWSHLEKVTTTTRDALEDRIRRLEDVGANNNETINKTGSDNPVREITDDMIHECIMADNDQQRAMTHISGNGGGYDAIAAMLPDTQTNGFELEDEDGIEERQRWYITVQSFLPRRQPPIAFPIDELDALQRQITNGDTRDTLFALSAWRLSVLLWDGDRTRALELRRLATKWKNPLAMFASASYAISNPLLGEMASSSSSSGDLMLLTLTDGAYMDPAANVLAAIRMWYTLDGGSTRRPFRRFIATQLLQV